MALLRSYVSGNWATADGEGRPVLDAVTGEEVARVSAAGLDMAAASTTAGSAGGPALRELTFHQRAGLLKALGSHLREHRDELYALSAKTGATLATPSSTSTAASACCSATPARPGASCRTTPSTSTARWSRSASRASSPGSTS